LRQTIARTLTRGERGADQLVAMADEVCAGWSYWGFDPSDADGELQRIRHVGASRCHVIDGLLRHAARSGARSWKAHLVQAPA
jgi:hypothetical protein